MTRSLLVPLNIHVHYWRTTPPRLSFESQGQEVSGFIIIIVIIVIIIIIIIIVIIIIIGTSIMNQDSWQTVSVVILDCS